MIEVLGYFIFSNQALKGSIRTAVKNGKISKTFLNIPQCSKRSHKCGFHPTIPAKLIRLQSSTHRRCKSLLGTALTQPLIMIMCVLVLKFLVAQT